MRTIVDHANIYDDCLRLIVKKGWVLDAESGPQSGDYYIATKDDIKVVATNPIELLGLVSLAENASENASGMLWWGFVPGEDDIWKNLLKRSHHGP